MPKGKALVYSADELAFIQSVSAWRRDEAHAAFCQRFSRDDVTAGAFNGLCKRKGWMTGRDGRLQTGNVPANKGKKCAPGTGGLHPNARKTQFKGGVRQGVAVKLYKPIGTERMSKDGYRERKIHDGMPLQSRWRAAHLVEWEQTNGPLPEGYALKCLSSDRTNCDPSNWEAIPRALLPRLAGGNRYRDILAFDAAPDELKPTVLAVAKLEHRARLARRSSMTPTTHEERSE